MVSPRPLRLNALMLIEFSLLVGIKRLFTRSSKMLSSRVKKFSMLLKAIAFEYVTDTSLLP